MEDLGLCDQVFDIEVADNHNFYAGSSSAIKLCLVHNCAADVQMPLAIALEQYKRADMMYVKPDLKSKLVKFSKYFSKHLLNQMSNTVQSISHMEQHGAHVDVDYLRMMMSKQSPLLTVIKDTTKELLDTEAGQEANKRILGNAGKSTKSLFGSSVNMNVFEPGKKDHKEVLFFDVLKLKPINFTKTGQRGIGRQFIAAYKETVPEVQLFETMTKASKLWSTYVKGWYKKLMTHVDSATDHCLRPGYGFFTIVTGRLNSFKPSLQQIPSRGKLAYYIKRMFTPPVNTLGYKDDYSSHEVRVWSIISGDKVLAKSFQEGLNLRRQLISSDISAKEKLDLIRTELKKKGDLHIQNVKRFFNIWVNKDDPMRDAIKQIIFGVLYGKSAKTLAKDLMTGEMTRLRAKIRDLKKEIAKLEG